MATITLSTNISPSLHPDVLTGIEGYSEHKYYCQGADKFFAEAYETVQDIGETKRAVARDQTRNEQARAVAVGDKAEKYLNRLKSRYDGRIQAFNAALDSIDRDLIHPLWRKETKNR